MDDDIDCAFRKNSAVLNLWHIISKICTIAICVIVESQRVCCTKFVGIFMILLHVTFHVPSCNCPFLIVISPRMQMSCSHHLVFYCLKILHEIFIFFEGLLSYIISRFYEVVLVPFSPHKFVCLPCFSYWLKEIPKLC